MNLKPVLLVILLLLPLGCISRHIDLKTQFIITGNVFDKVTNQPLDKVEVIFIDTGFDSIRSKKSISNKIGESDNEGQINLPFNYWWGTDEGLFKSKPKKTFDIVLSRGDYREERLNFNAYDLPNDGYTIKVFLENVYMEQ